MTILQFKVGDAVCDSRGMDGKVIRFTRDTVDIEWLEGQGHAVYGYTDADLKAHGVVRWSPVTRIER